MTTAVLTAAARMVLARTRAAGVATGASARAAAGARP